MKKRYGFIYVDRNDAGEGTMKRYRKQSFYWYKKLIASNGEDTEKTIVKKEGGRVVDKDLDIF